MNAQHTLGPRLSSVQRFALKEILLGQSSIFERKHNRTRTALFHKGLLTAPAGGSLTGTGRVLAKQALQAEIDRRAAIAKAKESAALKGASPSEGDA